MGAPFASGAARGLQVVGSLALVPILLRSLGQEQFSLWMAITSLYAATSFVDLGLGGVLVNRLSQSGNEPGASARAVSSSVFGLTLLWGAAAALLLVLYPLLPWDRLFGLAAASQFRVAPAALLMFLTLCATAPLGLAGRVRLSLGESHVHSLWDAVSSVLALLSVLLAVQLGAGLTMVVAAAALASLAALVGNWLHLTRRRAWLVPRWAEVDWADLAVMFRQGALFSAIALCNAAAFGFDSLIAVKVFGASAAAGPLVALRLAAALQTLIGNMVLPYWPRFSRASTKSASARARALREAFAFFFLISAGAAGALFVLGPEIVRLWTGGAATLPEELALPLAIWILLFGFAQGLMTVFSVAHLIRTQVLIVTNSAVFIVVFKIAGAKLWGAPGLVWGGAAALLVAAVLPLSCLLVRDLKGRARDLTSSHAVDSSELG